MKTGTKLTVISFNPLQGLNGKAHRREKSFLGSLTVVSFNKGEFRTPIDLMAVSSYLGFKQFTIIESHA